MTRNVFGRFRAAVVAAGSTLFLVATAHAQVPGGLNGVYAGTYRCGQGETNLTLSVATTPSGEVTAHFTFYLPAGTKTQAYTYTLFGQYDPRTARFSLMPVRWETPQPRDFAMVGMNGTWDSNELTGTIVGANCSTFHVDREQSAQAAPASAPPRALAAAPAAPRGQAAVNSPTTARAPAATGPQRPARPQTGIDPKQSAKLEAQAKALDDAEKAVEELSNPVLTWKLTTKKDGLTDQVSTQLTAETGLKGGDDADFVRANAMCNDNGIAVFFYLGNYFTSKNPEFAWDQQDSTNGDPLMDVRMRVDGGGVHVAKGYPDKKGNTYFGNSLGLLFYEPGLVARATHDQQDAVTTGILPFDSFVAPLVREAARSAAEDSAASSAGPLREAVDAHSIRVELQVNGYDENPVLDINPQDPAFHKFAVECSGRFGSPTR